MRNTPKLPAMQPVRKWTGAPFSAAMRPIDFSFASLRTMTRLFLTRIDDVDAGAGESDSTAE